MTASERGGEARAWGEGGAPAQGDPRGVSGQDSAVRDFQTKTMSPGSDQRKGYCGTNGGYGGDGSDVL